MAILEQLLFFVGRGCYYLGHLRRRFMAHYFYLPKAKRTVLEFTPPLKINGPTWFNKSTKLGRNVNSNGLIVAGRGPITIGDNFHCGVECRIIAQNHNFRTGKAIPYDDTFIRKGVVIGNNVWLGDRVIILDGVEIGEGAIVQAGSVVVRNVPPLGIVGGHPARVFSRRNEEHYWSLKSAKKFF
ncbi:MAG: acyltransferase [Bacteroidota bacterium]